MYDLLPDSISIFGHDYKIVIWSKKKAKKKDLMGEFNNTGCKISLAPGMDPVTLCNTLLHEINHGNFWFMTLDEAENHEEVIVNNMTNGMIAALRNNPDLMKFVFTALGGITPGPRVVHPSNQN